MALRGGALYRCHLFSYAGPQTEGVTSRWTKDLVPIGDREVSSGEVVEMLVEVQSERYRLSGDSRLRFDVLEEDFVLTGGSDDAIVSYRGTNAAPPETDFRVQDKTTRLLELAADEDVHSGVERFKAQFPGGYADSILVLTSPGPPPRQYAIAWWVAERLEDYLNSEYYFIVNVDGAFEDQSEEILDVTADRVALPEHGIRLFPLPHGLDPLFTGVAPGVIVGEPTLGEGEPAAIVRQRYRAGRFRVPTPAPGTEAPPEEEAPPADPNAITPWPWEHPARPASEDHVEPGPGPCADLLIAILPRWDTVQVGSERHAIVYDLRRALFWGQVLFGARTFTILEGPMGDDAGIHYYVVGTTQAITTTPGDPDQAIRVAGLSFWATPMRHWEVLLTVRATGEVYAMRGLFNHDDTVTFPPAIRWAVEFYREMQEREDADAQGGAVSRELARQTVFAGMDPTNVSEAARRLSQLGVHAFELLDTETRATYIQVLLDAWTFQAQRRAIIEIVKSIPRAAAPERPEAELARVIGLLERRGVYTKLIEQLDGDLWGLLTLVGQRFRDQPLTLDDLGRLLVDTGLVRTGVAVAVLGPAGLVISTDALAELRAACRGAWTFVEGMAEGFWMLLTEPDKIVEGIGQLMKFVIYYQIAPFNEEARRFVMGVVQQMGQKVRHGLNGMRVLDDLATENVSEDIVRRIKWAIIFEIASWFIGVGEIRAAVETAVAFGRGFEVARLLRGAETAAGIFRAADRAVDVGHVADVVRVTTRVAEVEGATSRIGRVVEVLAQPGVLGSEEQAWRLLSHLPEGDIDRLARAVGDTDLREIRDLATLARRHPEIAAEAQRVLERAQCLAALEAKSGGRLSDNVVRGFEALATRSGFENADLLELVNALPEENVELFMRAINVMPPEAFGRGVGARSYSFFQGLAAHPGAMEFVAGHGYETFAAIYRRGGFNWSRLDEDLRALRIIESSMLRRNLRTGYQQVLDGLRQGSPVAEATLANARSAIGAARRLPPEVTLLPEELELMFRAIGAEEEASRARLLDELVGRLRGRASESDIDRLRRRLRDRNVTQRARTAEALAPDLQARRVQELDNEAALLDEVEGRTLEMSEGPDRRRTEQWLYRLDLDEQLARAEARQLRASVEASPALRAVAENGGGPMLRRLWAMFRAPRPPSRQLSSTFERYVEILATRHFRGNYGEFEVAFRLSDRYIILKPPTARVTVPGTDLIVIPRGGGPLWIIDNKALTAEELTRVNALTRNFPRNLQSDIDEFARLAGQADVPAHMQLALNRMRRAQAEITPIVDEITERLAARGFSGEDLERRVLQEINTPATQARIAEVLERHQIRRVVTPAGGEVTGLSDELTRMGIELEPLD